MVSFLCRFTFKGVLTAKQPKGCDAKLQGLIRRPAEWQPVATSRRLSPCGWIAFLCTGRGLSGRFSSVSRTQKTSHRNPRKQAQIKKKVKYQTMKKKPLLFALLALAIVTSLTAGTLAIYTRTLDLNAGIEIKRFAFNATGGVVGDTKAIKLAPGEEMKYQFSITNFKDKESPAEVPLDYDISIDFIDATKKMPGLTATLDKTDGTSEIHVGTTDDGHIEDKDQSPASKAKTIVYTLTVKWGGTDDKEHTKAGTAVKETKGLNITVTATQATATK